MGREGHGSHTMGRRGRRVPRRGGRVVLAVLFITDEQNIRRTQARQGPEKYHQVRLDAARYEAREATTKGLLFHPSQESLETCDDFTELAPLEQHHLSLDVYSERVCLTTSLRPSRGRVGENVSLGSKLSPSNRQSISLTHKPTLNVP